MVFNKIAILLIGIVGVSLLFAGCARSGDAVDAEEACIATCELRLQMGDDLSNGPCLHDRIIADWVCDVAHDPREPVDDDPAYQCPSFGTATNHFVELDPSCNLIRTE